MAASITLDKLPDDPLLHILSYLDYKDLVSCCHVCHRLQALGDTEKFWKVQCRYYWLQLECPHIRTWKQHFIRWYQNFGRYIHIYRDLRKAWDQILEYTYKHCPKLYASINDGLSEGELNEIETKIHHPLPDDLRCSYRIHNGQRLVPQGLMGTLSISNHYRSEVLLDLNMASNNYQDHGDLQYCMPLTLCAYTNVAQLVVLSEESGLEYGHIMYPSPDNIILSNSNNVDNFITGKCFKDWFTSYAQDIADGRFPVVNKLIYRLYHEPSCIAVTNGITVTVHTAFMPELSTINPQHFFFVYYISMSMSPDASPDDACQLQTRHWVITNEDGHEERISGPGVVGEYPVMRPGANFTWTSCTTFDTTYGNMKGHFTMTKLKTGFPMEVECPIFHMKCLPYVTSGERMLKASEIKKTK